MEPNVTTTPTVTTRSAGIRYGVIGGLISIVYFLVLTTAGVDMSQGIGRWAGMIITIVIIFLAHKYYKDNGDGFMSYGQGIGIGFWIGLVSAVISSIFTYIYAEFIDPSFITTIREKAIADMEAKGTPQSQIDAAMPWIEGYDLALCTFIVGPVFWSFNYSRNSINYFHLYTKTAT